MRATDADERDAQAILDAKEAAEADTPEERDMVSACSSLPLSQRRTFVEKAIRAAIWMEYHWVIMVILLVVSMMPWVVIVMFSWSYGFWSNGLYGTHFDLSSCLNAVGVIVAALGGVATLAKAAWTKYDSDSRFNSSEGKIPTMSDMISGAKSIMTKEPPKGD